MEGNPYINAAFKSDQAPASANHDQPPPSTEGNYSQNPTFIQQAYVPPRSQVGVVLPTPPPTIPQAENFKYAKSLIGLGITQVVFGALVIIVEILIQTGFSFFFFRSFTGFWCGIFFIVAGILGILAGKLNNMGCVIACMVACIINTAFVATSGIGLYAVHASFYKYEMRYFSFTLVILCFIGMIICILEGIIALTNSVFTCAVCCGKRSHSKTTYPSYPQPQAVYVATQATPCLVQQTGGYPPAQH